ncbi:hemerythrin domain-containing protein [Castellaniella sp.]|uniref:hemerythrin domain-containing protein n=1 Tax=Castellaniella sp. TaxID=1955812 RepID=UPI003C71D354
MSSPSSPDPIARLLAVHAETRTRLQALAAGGAAVPADFAALAAWIDGPAHIAHDILEQRLFPALIESMAGSDAVCLKGMTGGLAQSRTDLDRRWHQAARLLERTAPDDPANPAARDALAAWADDTLAWLKRADEELLPMADRLLDGTALAELAADCARLDDGA